jgi:hypothetical protein
MAVGEGAKAIRAGKKGGAAIENPPCWGGLLFVLGLRCDYSLLSVSFLSSSAELLIFFHLLNLLATVNINSIFDHLPVI